MITVEACSPRHFAGILDLQHRVHRDNVDAETRAREGFVSWRHTREDLAVFNAPMAHRVALGSGGTVVGYALSMDPVHAARMPQAAAFIAAVEREVYGGRPLAQHNYTAMGQVAIAAQHRGRGLFRRLYEAWFAAMAERYELAVTEIAAANTHSRAAHRALGWKDTGVHLDGEQEWLVVVKELR